MVAEDRNSTGVTVAKVTQVEKDRVNVGTVVTITHSGNALPMGRKASDGTSPITSRSSAEATHRTDYRVEVVVVGRHVRT